MSDYTVLVNSSDGYADCWAPFFTLFARHWPACAAPLLLNTEHASFAWPDVPLRCTQVAQGVAHRLTWSECLTRALDQITTPLVLYLQEDFFLEAPVRGDLVDQFAAYMLEHEIANLRLVECGGSGPWQPTEHPLLWVVDPRARYRVALQAGLWRVDTLRQRLRAHESAWQLEVFGSRRAWRVHDRVLCVNRDLFERPQARVVPYYPTGVVKGRWLREAVVDLFAAHAIEVDFSRRGFYDPNGPPPPRRALWRRAADRMRSLA